MLNGCTGDNRGMIWHDWRYELIKMTADCTWVSEAATEQYNDITWINYFIWSVFLKLHDELKLRLDSENSDLFELGWLLCSTCIYFQVNMNTLIYLKNLPFCQLLSFPNKWQLFEVMMWPLCYIPGFALYLCSCGVWLWALTWTGTV